jgi:ribonucleoside-diphosphate reductase alpha chain
MRVLSLPDGVAQVLAEYLDRTAEQTHPATNGHAAAYTNGHAAATQPALPGPQPVGDLCPDCGDGALVNEEGCRKCYSCGYSEC